MGKKKKSNLSDYLNTPPPVSRKETYINSKIVYYVKKFTDNMHKAINEAQRKWTCLSPDHIHQDLMSKMTLKITDAIANRKVSLWRTNDKVINVYIQGIIRTTILDEVRYRRKQDENIVDSSILLMDENNDKGGPSCPSFISNALADDRDMTGLTMKRFFTGYEYLCAELLYNKILKRLSKTNPKGKELFIKMVMGQDKINYSSQEVADLREEIKLIIKKIQKKEKKEVDRA